MNDNNEHDYIPVLYITLPECPACKGQDLGNNGLRGGNTRYYVCRDCETTFKVIVRNPRPAADFE
jgi:transposase-like protein